MPLSIFRVSIFRAGRPAVAAALAAILLLAANAQSRSAGIASAPAPRQTMRPLLPAQAPSAAGHAQSVETNLSQLHQKLQITAAQQPKFDAFANAMRTNARMTPSTPPANATAVDDLRVVIQDRELELTALKRLLPPLQALYASLSPAQQKLADQVFRQGPAE